MKSPAKIQHEPLNMLDTKRMTSAGIDVVSPLQGMSLMEIFKQLDTGLAQWAMQKKECNHD